MNDNKICIMIKCIVSNERKNSSELKNILTEKIVRRWSQAKILLKREEQYWKYKDSSVIVYGISNETIIAVRDLISLFDVTWIYSCGSVLSLNTQMSEEIEEGLWSKNVHTEESFLLNWVTWVHIYTWSE